MATYLQGKVFIINSLTSSISSYLCQFLSHDFHVLFKPFQFRLHALLSFREKRRLGLNSINDLLDTLHQDFLLLHQGIKIEFNTLCLLSHLFCFISKFYQLRNDLFSLLAKPIHSEWGKIFNDITFSWYIFGGLLVLHDLKGILLTKKESTLKRLYRGCEKTVTFLLTQLFLPIKAPK